MIRFYLILLFFLVSLLSLLKAPAYHLWLLAIGVSEFPLIFAGITALLMAAGFWPQKFQLAGTILGFITLVIFLSPVARAYRVSSDIKPNLVQAFGTSEFINSSQGQSGGFVFSKLFKAVKAITFRSMTYVKYADTSLSLDFYPSQIPGKRPCIIVVHGGSWAGGDSKQLPELNSYLAAKGYHVAAINYRMAPRYQSPAPVQDIKAALFFLAQHATAMQIDTNNFVLLGRSAGAQIALLAAYTLNEPGIKGVIDFYGPADMVWGYSIPSNPLIMDSRKVMRDYVGGSYLEAPQKYAACSPLEFVSSSSVPTLMIHGDNDVLVSNEHSRRLNAKLQQYGIKHYWLKLPWATHGFDYNLYGPGGQLSTYAVEAFLHAVCPPAG